MRHLVISMLVLLAAHLDASAKVSIAVDVSDRQQFIEGFGAFGPLQYWWRDGPWYDKQFLDMVIDDMGATIMRTQLYWDYEEPQRTYNFDSNSGNGKQKPWLRDISARGIKILATVWTPPIWMKLNPDDSLASFCHGQCGGRLNPALRQKFAEYLAHYVSSLKSELDIDLYGLSLQNEPIFTNPFESCVYTASEYAETLKIVGAHFASVGLKTKLFGPEHMGDYERNSGGNQNFIAELLDDDPVARSYLDIYAVHGYLDGVEPDYSDAAGWSAFHRKAAVQHGLQLWMTETSYGQTTNWSKAFDMARGLHLALRHGRINAWIYWTWAPNILSGHNPTPQYYTLKQYYRYIRPGYEQVASTSNNSDILVTAFERSGWLTLVMINNGSTSHTASIAVIGSATPGTFKAVRTSVSENAASLGNVSPSNVDLPPQSITTLFTGSPELEPPAFFGWKHVDPLPDGAN